MEGMLIDINVSTVIKESLDVLSQPGEVRELRILNTKKGTISGYYDNWVRMAIDAAKYDGKYNVFFTINPVKPELLARANNRLVPYSKQTSSDNDISRRIVFLPIDIDPVRPAGISSSDDEHELARKKALQIHRYLRKSGWPEGIIADSGNGYHLLYDVDLPNTDATKQLLRMVLQTLDFLFSTNKVQVDTTTSNPARIMKLYGTIACKGDDTEDRPHRRSEIIKVPEEIVCVTEEKLRELAKQLPNPPQSQTKNTGDSSQDSFNLREWLKEHGLDIALTGRWQNKGQKYILKGCPWNDSHSDRSAYVIQFDTGPICAGCHHAGCASENWYSLRDKVEPGWKDESSSSDKTNDETQAASLIRLGSTASFFRDSLDVAYAAVDIDGHKTMLKVNSKRFQMWLRKRYFQETGKAPYRDALNQALQTMEMMGVSGEEEVTLYRRVAEIGGIFYYDLADDACRVVKITAEGCELLSDPPLIFERGMSAKAQVGPDFSGSINLLWKHFRFKSQNDRILFTAYLISCFIYPIPHPVLVLAGEKGSAKSTTERMLKAIVDPAIHDLLTMPNSRADLALLLANNYLAAFDNLEVLSGDKSDLLCMASTGGSFSKRKLYTDDEEVFLTFKRCIAMNGINVVATRPDLLDRSIILELNRIKNEKRKEETQVWKQFYRDLPGILGAILTTLSKAMAIYPTVNLAQLPRMADFARWGYAITEASGKDGELFLTAYQANQDESNEEALASHPVASSVIAFMKKRTSWKGSVSVLLSKLEECAEKEKISTNSKLWPRAAHILSRRLKEVKSNLEDVGITYSIRHGGDSKYIELKKVPKEPSKE